MKIALISDIHGNLVALNAALAAIAGERPDQIICLGDVVVTGPQPEAALARIRETGCPVVMGNTDEWVLSPQPFNIRSETDQVIYDIEKWSAEQMSDADREFLKTFASEISLDLGDGPSLLCCHGSPRSNIEIITATLLDEKLAEIIEDLPATIIAGGHTHTPLLRRWQDKFILNPGSIGLPFFRDAAGTVHNPAWAEYAIITVSAGLLDISLKRVNYELAALRTAVFASDMPHADRYLAHWEAFS